MLNETRMRTFLTVFGIALLIGCTGDLVELTPGGPKDMTAPTGGGDAGQGGGGEMGPSTLKFFPDIQGDMDAKTCTSVACHGSTNAASNGGFSVKPMPTAQADIDANYMAVMNEVNTTTPDQSPLLIQPGTAGSGHTGGMVFTTGTADPTYQRWLAWITAKAPE